jgi:ubiquinone/menaquinone biosynthesis C-methylase UbiE
MANDVYTHGHHESVLRSHTWRTAENSAAHLLPRLRPGMDLLDVGCGPGTLTVDLARRVAPGRVVGLDRSAEVLAQAGRHAEAAGVPVTFRSGDVYALDLPDASFDVVHAHQVLQHLTDPVAALREMRRVLRPGGTVAVRDGDYSCFSWAPLDPLLERWLAVYRAVARHNRAEPDAGRFLKRWARGAGFERVEASSSTWTFSDEDSCRWWGGLWADRCLLSSFGEQAVAYGIASRDELAAMADAWRRWSVDPDAFFVVPHGEVLASD